LNDAVGAREAFLKAKNAVEEELKRSPDVEKTHIQLAKVLAHLARRTPHWPRRSARLDYFRRAKTRLVARDLLLG